MRKRTTVLFGALSPSPDSHSQPPPPSTRATTTLAPSLDAGLGLFAALTTHDPKTIEIADLRAALENTRNELESRNLLLIRSKEALSTLGERVSSSSQTIQLLKANECRLESELDNSRTTCKENQVTQEATIQNLSEHLTKVRTQYAQDMTTARETFAQQEHDWQKQIVQVKELNVDLRARLTAAQSIEMNLNEELSQAQDNIENLVTEVSTVEHNLERVELSLKSSNELALLHLSELNQVQEQLRIEEQQRIDLAARVSTTEQDVIDRLLQKQMEVDTLKLKVNSQQRHYLKKRGAGSGRKGGRNGGGGSSSSSSSSENKENYLPPAAVAAVHCSKHGKGTLKTRKITPGKKIYNTRTPSKEEQLLNILNNTPTSGSRIKKKCKKKKVFKNSRRSGGISSLR